MTIQELCKQEILNPLKEYENDYLISSKGKIWSNNKNKWLNLNLATNGYYMVSLKNKYTTLHRLLAKTFISNPLNKREVNHKNGKKSDNRLKNLEWSTTSENMKHGFKIGIIKTTKKQRIARSKTGKNTGKINSPWKRLIPVNLSNKIRKEYKELKLGYKGLAKKYNVSKDTIIRLIKKKGTYHDD